MATLAQLGLLGSQISLAERGVARGVVEAPGRRLSRRVTKAMQATRLAPVPLPRGPALFTCPRKINSHLQTTAPATPVAEGWRVAVQSG